MPFVCNFDNIDTSYDDLFNNRLDLPWLPWVGKRFSQTDKKTMILGESTYNWDPGNEEVAKRISKSDHLRIIHQNHALNYNRSSGFVRNIEKAIFYMKAPTVLEKKLLWSSVVYHNLVLRAMRIIDDRPKYNDYLTGWKVFIDMSTLINIEQCIVYGLERNKIDSLIETLKAGQIFYNYRKLKVKIGKSYPRIVDIHLEDKQVKLIFIRHPSSYFSWEKWGGILRNEFQLPRQVELASP